MSADIRIDGQAWVAPGDVPEDAQCTARTKRGRRCGNPLDYGQSNGWSWLPVEGGYVDGFDYDHNNGQLTERGRRYLEQRCELHFNTDAPSEVEPEWEPFDPASHRAKIVSAERVLSGMAGGASATMANPQKPKPNRAPSPDNDGVPINVLRPVMDRCDLSIGGRGLWAMLVSYYWSCEANRSVDQLHEHRPQDVEETDALLEELVGVGLIEVITAPDGERIVSINADALGAVDSASERLS
ncbi:MAG: hypothetical protein ABS81_06345 [Pseudonocardia sp. SCN 72-86]|nr:MAG: hypothetical protein ABS81_06345 [Pseudonocardia sp. SCN 72-86]